MRRTCRLIAVAFIVFLMCACAAANQGYNGNDSYYSEISALEKEGLSLLNEGLLLLKKKEYRQALEKFALSEKKFDRAGDICYDELEDCYMDEHVEDSRKALLYTYSGMAYLGLGDLDRAQSEAEWALRYEEYSDQKHLAHVLLANVYILKGDKDAAWNEYVILKDLHPETAALVHKYYTQAFGQRPVAE